MERYDLLYRLYEEEDTDTLRQYRDFVDLFPPVDSRVALEYWEDASQEFETRRSAIAEAFRDGEVLADIAAHATREQAFTALDLCSKYDREVNALVLDVDETLRSAGGTDNEIPRHTLHLLTEFVESGLPVVICTGQTLENVKGFAIQGLGNELVHSGDVSIVYEAGTGVFTPGHGEDTKRLLYEDLAEAIREVFDGVRSRALSDAPPAVRRACHLQGNEFNVTLKPNFETGSEDARTVIDQALCWLVDLVGESVAARVDGETEAAVDGETEAAVDTETAHGYARAFYAAADPEIEAVLASEGRDVPAVGTVPEGFAETFERVDVAYYEADAAEVGSLELDKPRGVEAALSVLDIEDPFVLVMGDSKSDLRVMEWAREHDAGIAAAPAHSSPDVVEHVRATDDLVFDRGRADSMLRTVYALNRLASLPEREV